MWKKISDEVFICLNYCVVFFFLRILLSLFVVSNFLRCCDLFFVDFCIFFLDLGFDLVILLKFNLLVFFVLIKRVVM